MPGAVLQIVANSGATENKWLDADPQITFFKKVYRRHTPFATELVPVPMDSTMDFGRSGDALLLPHGDLLSRIMFTCEIPMIATAFLNPKAADISKVITSSNLFDTIFYHQLIKFTSITEQVEVERIIDTIDSTLNCYSSELTIRTNVLADLKTFSLFLGPEEIPSKLAYQVPTFDPTPGPPPIPPIPPTLAQLDDETGLTFNFIKLKMDLAQIWLNQKKKYFLIYELLTELFVSQYNIINGIPIINTSLFASLIINASTFFTYLPNREILLMFYIRNLNYTQVTGQTNNSLIQAFDIKLTNLYNDFITNYPTYLFFNQIFSGQTLSTQVNNPDFTVSYLAFDTHTLLEQVCSSFDDNYTDLPLVQGVFYDYGPSFFYILNAYNLIINMIMNIGTTVPIIIAKAFGFTTFTPTTPNVYTDVVGTTLTADVYPTIVDPNYQEVFNYRVSNPQPPFLGTFLFPSTEPPNDVQIYPSDFTNQYLNIFNQQSTYLFNSVTRNMDALYEMYRPRLFTQTQFLYLFDSPPLANIYGYQVPTQGFQDHNAVRINNVFNLNIWFFYFFTYLGTFNEVNYSNYIVGYTNYNLSPNALQFLTSMITLLKIDIEYYMTEISYMLNDLYAKPPSTFAADTMKTYVPKAYASTIDGVDIRNGLLGTTMLFYRNHTQTIMEMFQYMFYFCDTISVAQINTYLLLSIGPISPAEMTIVRRLNKLVYYHILGYFMNIYDSMKFEPPANYSFNEFNAFNNDNQIIGQYVLYFLKNISFQPYPQPSQSQAPLFVQDGQTLIISVDYVGQMEFYFVAEMVNMRALENFYYNSIFNDDLILSQVGQSTFDLVSLLRTLILKTDNNFTIDLAAIARLPDPTRSYYDILYQHNVRLGRPDNLYYATFNLDRFNGQSYVNTSYQSRDFGIVPKPPAVLPLAPPFPLPPTDPYGINPDYYYNTPIPPPPPPYLVPITSVPLQVYWVNTVSNPYNTKNNQTTAYQLYDIDYFRIQHKVFLNTSIVIPPNIRFIDDFQMYSLRLIALTKQYLLVTSTTTFNLATDFNLLYYIFRTIPLIRDNINHALLYETYLHVYDFGPSPTLFDMLAQYFLGLLDAIHNNLPFPVLAIVEILNACNEIFNRFNSGEHIEIGPQAPVYTEEDLAACNLYTYNVILNAPIVNNDIIDRINIVKMNFLSEYFFYVKFESSIITVNGLGAVGDNFIFQNSSLITYDIMSQINVNNVDLTVLQNASPLIYIYPDVYPVQVQQIINLFPLFDNYSQTVFQLITSFMSPNTTPRLTVNDIYDLINMTFMSTEEIYLYTLADTTQTVYTYLISILAVYQPLLINKQLLFNEIDQYILTIPPTQLMVTADVVTIASFAASFGINYNDYFNYITTVIQPQFNASTVTSIEGVYPYNRVVVINIILNNDLDYFFLKWVKGDPTVILGVTLFKPYIINNIFTATFLAANPTLRPYFNFIPNSIYQYIYTFLIYAQTNGLTAATITNPVYVYTKFNLDRDQGIVSVQYDSFKYLGNILEYFMDYVWDWTMTVCDRDPTVIINDFGYTERFSLNVNAIHLANLAEINNKLAQLTADRNLAIEENAEIAQEAVDQLNVDQYFKNKQLQAIINALKQDNPDIVITELAKIGDRIQSESEADTATPLQTMPSTYPVSNYDYYFEKIDERIQIINFIEQVAQRGIVLVNTNSAQLINLRNQLYNIFYRNKLAKNAWIRKLAHFLIKEVQFRIDDQIGDVHPSDWFEIFHELTKSDGSEYGYSKMIGHREDLTIFDDKLKKSYIIVMPLIFYFNRNIISALPLTASINTQYLLHITLRKLTEVTYKEQFADFINPGLHDQITFQSAGIQPFVPKLSNVFLMVEYIYLTTEERKVFVSNMLEYLIEEIQYDVGTNISDGNMLPVYQISTQTSAAPIVPIAQSHYDPYKGIYIDRDELDALNFAVDLLPRNDYVSEPHTDRTGVTKLMMTYKPLPGIDPYVHFKKFYNTFKFGNPTEFMTVLIKPDFHTQPIFRLDEKSYFYNELQWDNYGLYSYFDLTPIYNAKANYYNTLVAEFDNNNDPIYGFINVINTLIAQYTVPPLPAEPTNPIETWINNNLAYFLATLQRIKEAYLAYGGTFIEFQNIIRLKENLVALNLNYNVWQQEFLVQLINDIFDILDQPHPTMAQIVAAYTDIIPGFDITNFTMTKDEFRLGIMVMLYDLIVLDQITVSAIDNAINSIYTNYNEVEINFTINNILAVINVDNLTYNVVNIVGYFRDLYLVSVSPLPALVLIITTINNVLQNLPSNDTIIYNNNPILYLKYKEIIYQIIPLIGNPDTLNDYLTLIPFFVVLVVSLKMNQTFNNILDTNPVVLINYQQNMIPNKKINPLQAGFLSFNSYNIMPENTTGNVWSALVPYACFQHTPSTGINVYSWSIDPISNQPTGAVNMNRIDEFTGTFLIHPLIGNAYSATMESFVMSDNMVRYLSGLGGKMWNYASKKIE